MQKILQGAQGIDWVLAEMGCRRYMLVCDSSFPFLPIKKLFDTEVIFNQISPNPLYEDVCRGVEMFNANNCEALVAVGGGSTIDVAKCIKLFCRMNPETNYLLQAFSDSGIPLVAIPSTAGTGSESTRYAVIYFEGKKQSITHESIIPDYAVLEPALLKTLPLYQKKCTMLDALCQGVESLWSVNSTDESMVYSRMSVRMIMDHWYGYIENDSEEAAFHIMQASNFAGRAINITQTTAPHAMSYKLTSIYGIPHGHAVALCLPGVWQYMMDHPDRCADPRGSVHLKHVLKELDCLMQCNLDDKGLVLFRTILCSLQLPKPQVKNRDAELATLVSSVNPVRLKNNPVPLEEDTIRNIYNNILP